MCVSGTVHTLLHVVWCVLGLYADTCTWAPCGVGCAAPDSFDAVSRCTAIATVLCYPTGPPGAGPERVLPITSLQRTPVGTQLQRSGTFITFASVMCLCCWTLCFVHSSLYSVCVLWYMYICTCATSNYMHVACAVDAEWTGCSGQYWVDGHNVHSLQMGVWTWVDCCWSEVSNIGKWCNHK